MCWRALSQQLAGVEADEDEPVHGIEPTKVSAAMKSIVHPSKYWFIRPWADGLLLEHALSMMTFVDWSTTRILRERPGRPDAKYSDEDLFCTRNLLNPCVFGRRAVSCGGGFRQTCRLSLNTFHAWLVGHKGVVLSPALSASCTSTACSPSPDSRGCLSHAMTTKCCNTTFHV